MNEAIEKIAEIICEESNCDIALKMNCRANFNVYCEGCVRIATKVVELGFRLLPEEKELPLLSDEEIDACWSDETINPKSGGYDADKIIRKAIQAQRHLIYEVKK